MAIRKPAAILNGYNALHTPYSRSSPSTRPTSSTPQCPRDRQRKRAYATIADSHNNHDHEHRAHGRHTQHDWPKPQHPHRVPTPYQILGCRRGDQYTKVRFTELVKIYHPDRCDHPECKNLSQEIRLERYRLVVLAHAILSCPQKRSAYDTLGAGWGAHENLGEHRANRGFDKDTPTHGPDSAMGNATWEDWEKWHQKYGPHSHDNEHRDPQHPIFLSNTAFVSVIVMLAALGGIGQVTRAEASGRTFLHQRNEAHEKAAAELEKVRQSSSGWSREERIKMFLRQRDPAAYENDGVRNMLLDPDVCEGGDVRAENRESDFRRKYSDTQGGERHSPELYRNPP